MIKNISLWSVVCVGCFLNHYTQDGERYCDFHGELLEEMNRYKLSNVKCFKFPSEKRTLIKEKIQKNPLDSFNPRYFQWLIIHGYKDDLKTREAFEIKSGEKAVVEG